MTSIMNDLELKAGDICFNGDNVRCIFITEDPTDEGCVILRETFTNNLITENMFLIRVEDRGTEFQRIHKANLKMAELIDKLIDVIEKKETPSDDLINQCHRASFEAVGQFSPAYLVKE